MSTIKKAYQDIVAFLEENANSKVSTVLPQVIEMASAKVGGGGRATTFHRNEAGDIVAIRCFYHGLWMSPEVAEFGKKASSPTGLNSMCKDGVSKWTKQQNAAKKAKNELLEQVASGELEGSDLAAALEQVEAERASIYVFDETDVANEGYGFETLDECLADNEARGVAY